MSAAIMSANAAIMSANAALMAGRRNGGLGLNIAEILRNTPWIGTVVRGFVLVCLILIVLYILINVVMKIRIAILKYKIAKIQFEYRYQEEMYKKQVHEEKVRKSNKILEERALRLKEKFKNFNKNF